MRNRLARIRAALGPEALEKIVFILALCFLTYLGGAATVIFRIFPYPILQQAGTTLRAQLDLVSEEMPTTFREWEPEDSPLYPTRQLSPMAGREHLLMTGGFYHHMDVCPQFGCAAWIMDRQGRVLHTWPAPDPTALFSDAEGFSGRNSPENFYIMGATMTRAGALIIVFQARNVFPYQVGTAKLGVNGELEWLRFDGADHWPTVGPSGRVYSPFTRLQATEDRPDRTGVESYCEGGTVYTSGVRVMSPDGDVEREFDIGVALSQADYPGLAYGLRDGCDPDHLNWIEEITPAGAVKLNAEVGDLLVSLREKSSLVVLDKDSGAVKRVIAGRTAAQHSPRLMPDGTIVVFDNQGGLRATGGSRVLLIDPQTRRTRTIFPTDRARDLLPFNSKEAGIISVSPDGSRLMVSETHRGRVIEIDAATGEPLWLYENLMDLAPYLERQGSERPSTIARIATQGTFYLGDAPFLNEPEQQSQ